jgi:leucine dehydrogenase
VGSVLCEHLAKEGVVLKINDRNETAIEKIREKVSATVIPSEELLTTECDIFAPCAMGAVLNTENVKGLRCRMVAGAANNVLLDAATGDALKERGILYLPDYIINAGGVINCGMEIPDGTYDVELINKKVDGIYDTTLKIVALATEKQISTYKAADEYAVSIINTHKK